MSTNDLPDDVKARLAWADQAEDLLRRILSALGFERVVSAADLLAGVSAWLLVLGYAKRDESGRLCSAWHTAYDAALRRSGALSHKAAHEEAVEVADMKVDAFAQRFPPMIEDQAEEPRDTESDLDALRQELAEREESLAAAMARIQHLELKLKVYLG